MNLNDMSKDERSLLLYIESVAVDNAGLIDNRKINDEDRQILGEWDKKGFIFWSRITWESLQKLTNHYTSTIVRLSNDAWTLAHEERRARNIRMSEKSPYSDLVTTKEVF
jgi:hypothetical protein